MKFGTLITTALFAAGVLAAPRPSHPTKREFKIPKGPISQRIQRVRNENATEGSFGSRIFADISTNWAGAYILPPEGSTFDSLQGLFTVPDAGPGGTSVAIWIGIDGNDPDIPLIQGGIYIAVEPAGTAGAVPWTEWIPDPPVFYTDEGFLLAPGDECYVGLSVKTGDDVALFIIDNLTQGFSLSKEFSPIDGANVALGRSAEWIVERPSGTVLSNFGSVTFTGCTATSGADIFDVSGGTATSIQQSQEDNLIIAVGSIPAADTVRVDYTGP